MDIYRNRWMIELFFKWIKQHLKLTKIWSTKPQGIWNQMFLALIAFGRSLIVKLQTKSTKTSWQFFRILQTYLYRSVNSFIKELNRKKKKSNGRHCVTTSFHLSSTILFDSKGVAGIPYFLSFGLKFRGSNCHQLTDVCFLPRVVE
jgi:hypothetical protein